MPWKNVHPIAALLWFIAFWMKGSALAGAADMGLSRSEMLSVVRQLRITDFVKSMTTHVDHRTWQDVYRPLTRGGLAYVKLTVIDDVLIVSFKES